MKISTILTAASIGMVAALPASKPGRSNTTANVSHIQGNETRPHYGLGAVVSATYGLHGIRHDNTQALEERAHQEHHHKEHTHKEHHHEENTHKDNHSPSATLYGNGEPKDSKGEAVWGPSNLKKNRGKYGVLPHPPSGLEERARRETLKTYPMPTPVSEYMKEKIKESNERYNSGLDKPKFDGKCHPKHKHDCDELNKADKEWNKLEHKNEKIREWKAAHPGKKVPSHLLPPASLIEPPVKRAAADHRGDDKTTLEMTEKSRQRLDDELNAHRYDRVCHSAWPHVCKAMEHEAAEPHRNVQPPVELEARAVDPEDHARPPLPAGSHINPAWYNLPPSLRERAEEDSAVELVGHALGLAEELVRDAAEAGFEGFPPGLVIPSGIYGLIEAEVRGKEGYKDE